MFHSWYQSDWNNKLSHKAQFVGYAATAGGDHKYFYQVSKKSPSQNTSI